MNDPQSTNSITPCKSEMSDCKEVIEVGTLPPPLDIAALQREADEAREREHPFREAKAALKEQLHFGLQWGLLPSARENDRYGRGNILGMGIAEKLVNSQPIGELAVRVYVITKAPAEKVAPGSLIPMRINGLPTDVIETGEIRSAEIQSGKAYPVTTYSGAMRQIPAGVSVGWGQRVGLLGVTGSDGTLGCFVERDSAIHLLSCNHILLQPGHISASTHERIYQPALTAGGAEQIAEVSRWVVFNPSATNRADCAMAKVFDTVNVTPKLHCLPDVWVLAHGVIHPWFAASTHPCRRGLRVWKCGAETGKTSGVVSDCDLDWYEHVNGRDYYLEDQIQIDGAGFASFGDSGAVVYYSPQLDGVQVNLYAVGLLWGGHGSSAGATPMQRVLDLLHARIAHPLGS